MDINNQTSIVALLQDKGFILEESSPNFLHFTRDSKIGLVDLDIIFDEPITAKMKYRVTEDSDVLATRTKLIGDETDLIKLAETGFADLIDTPKPEEKPFNLDGDGNGAGI